jgi:hypothetical protein
MRQLEIWIGRIRLFFGIRADRPWPAWQAVSVAARKPVKAGAHFC